MSKILKKAICIGSATKDIFVTVENSLVIENKVDITAQKLFGFEFGAKIYAKTFQEELGGSAVSVATTLSRCGKRAFIFSRVSKSELGKWIEKRIGRLKIKKNYLQKRGGLESEVSVIISDEKHLDHVIFRTGDSVESFDIEKALKRFKEKVDLIFIASQKKNWQDVFEKVIAFAKSKKAILTLNPSSFQITNHSKELVHFLPFFEIIFLNKDEAIELVKNNEGIETESINLLSEKILSWGIKKVVITDGKNGAFLASFKEGLYHLGILDLSKKETTGAGDAFAGGFLAAFMNGKDQKECLCWGIANSASVISQKGSTKGILKERELKQLASRLVDKVEKIN